MNNFLSLFRSSLLRAKTVLIISLVISLGVAFLAMTLADSGESETPPIRLGFIDEDGSAASIDLARYLKDDLKMELVRSKGQSDSEPVQSIDPTKTGSAPAQSIDPTAFDSELVEKRISGVIAVPNGFEHALIGGAADAPAELTFMDDYANEAFVRGYIDAYMDSLVTLAAAANGDSAKLDEMIAHTAAGGIEIKTAARDAEAGKRQSDMEGFNFMLGFFMMFCFMMSISISQMLYEDRANGTYRRIKAGKVTSVQYVASVAAIGFVIALLIEGPALLLYALSGSYSGVPIGITILMLFVFTVFVVALGIFLGISANGTNSIVSVLIAVATITSMLGGAWFPIELAPSVFPVLSLFTPQYWTFDAISSYQEGAGSIGLPVTVILLTSLLFYILAGIRFTSNRSAARV
ncbi:MAG: ABC transporter permease [Clostridiales Family XIII bacterium]|nr:ABC transporter permease [Clostridiales Family XIII bacterium]